ncbi:MAG: hypothetical protein ABI763_16995, partial [Bacteroidota bacterium]
MVSDPDTIHLSIYSTMSECVQATGTVKVVATGGSSDSYYYYWTPNSETRDSIGGLLAGVYSVSVNDEKGCTVDTSVLISDSDGPDASFDVTANVGCNGYNDGSIELNLAIGSLPTDPIPLCTNAAGNNNRLAAGSYPIIITDSSGCITVLVATITEPPPLSLLVSTTQSQCGDSSGSATIVATGGSGALSYSWSTGGISEVENDIPSGFDTITVTDENGCVALAVAVITDSDGPTLISTSTNLSCFNSDNGTVSVHISSGSAPYQYLWYEIGRLDSSVDSLSEGSFNVLVTDSFGCKSMATAIIISPPPLESIFSTIKATNDSSFDGSTFAEIHGGTPPYEYLWLPDSQTTSEVFHLGFDSLSIEVTDASGCHQSHNWPGILSPTYTCPPNSGGARDDMANCNVNYDPCPTHNCIQMSIAPYNNLPNFGADPTGSSSSECAFEAANNYINAWVNSGLNNGDIFTLYFPPGTYIVGRQTLWGETAVTPVTGVPMTNYKWFAKGHDIFLLNGINGIYSNQINPLVFEGIPDQNGILPKIKYADCLSYGAFVPNGYYHSGYRYLMVASAVVPCQEAFIGCLFNISNSKYVTINNLELDGNLPNLALGGATVSGAGNNEQHYGILITGTNTYNPLTFGSRDITLNNVNVHHFGYAGIEIAPHNWQPIVNLILKDCKFNSNGCCGFAWEAGGGIRADNCRFNSNAIETITTIQACGMDIESGGVEKSHNGIFTNCEFKYNYLNGVTNSEVPPTNERDFTFKHCTFVGSEFSPGIPHTKFQAGNPIFLTTPGCHFDCCDFYGTINYSYDSPTEVDKMIFNSCSFNEEYEDPDGIHTWDFNLDCKYDCANPTGAAGPKKFLVCLGYEPAPKYKRLTFNCCSFNTNYSSSLCRLYGGGLTQTAIKIINCHFNSYGLNNAYLTDYCNYFTDLSNGSLFWMKNCNFIGNNTLMYC